MPKATRTIDTKTHAEMIIIFFILDKFKDYFSPNLLYNLGKVIISIVK